MLIYTGGGYGGSLPLIPSRDLSDEEVKRFGGEARLIATGLYAKSSASTQVNSKPRGTIDLSDGISADEKSLAGKTLRAAQGEK